MADETVLIIVSKVKGYIKTKSEMNTAANVAPKLTEMVQRLCDQAIARARKDGRKTVMDRDFDPQG